MRRALWAALGLLLAAAGGWLLGTWLAEPSVPQRRLDPAEVARMEYVRYDAAALKAMTWENPAGWGIPPLADEACPITDPADIATVCEGYSALFLRAFEPEGNDRLYYLRWSGAFDGQFVLYLTDGRTLRLNDIPGHIWYYEDHWYYATLDASEDYRLPRRYLAGVVNRAEAARRD